MQPSEELPGKENIVAVTGLSRTTGKYHKGPIKTRKAPEYKNTGLFLKIAFPELGPMEGENLQKV